MGRLSFIWPQHYCCDLAAYPPTLIGNKASHWTGRSLRWCTWHYSTQGLPGFYITTKTCELLPHIFTITASIKLEATWFLWHCLLPDFATRYPALHRCIALCCPDFPPFCKSRNAITRLVANGKNNHFQAVVRVEEAQATNQHFSLSL